jgi:hypothetical protein
MWAGFIAGWSERERLRAGIMVVKFLAPLSIGTGRYYYRFHRPRPLPTGGGG